MKRSHAQNVGIPISMGTAYGIGNSEGCAALGYAATCSEVSETNPSSVRESNSFAHSLKGFFSGISYRTIGLLLLSCILPSVAATTVAYKSITPDNNSVISKAEFTLHFDIDKIIEENGGDASMWGICYNSGYNVIFPDESNCARLYKGTPEDGELIAITPDKAVKPPSEDFSVGDSFTIAFPDVEIIPNETYTLVVTHSVFAGKVGDTNWTKSTKLNLLNSPVVATYVGASEVSKVLSCTSTSLDGVKSDYLKEVSLSFNYDVDVADNANITLCENGVTIASAKSISRDANNASIVNVEFDEVPLYNSHTYTLEAEAGVFSMVEDRSVKNSSISLPIEGSSYHMFGKKTVLPREGQTSLLEEIQMSFDFPEGYGFVYVSDNTKYPMQVYKVKSDGEELVEEVNGEYSNDVTLKFTPKNVLDASTKYKFVLEEDVVKPYQLGLSYPKRLQDYKCERIEVEYRTPDEGDIPKVEFAEVSEEYLTMARLVSEFHLPMIKYETETGSYQFATIGDPNIPLIMSDGTTSTEIGKIYVQQASFKLEEPYLRLVSWRPNGATSRQDLDLELEEGKTYSLTIPAGLFAAEQPLLKKYSGNEEVSFVFHGTTPTSHTVIINGSEGHATKLKAKRHQDMEVEFTAPENRNIEKVTYQEADNDAIDITEEAKTGSYLLTDICNDAQFFVTLDAASPVAPEYVNVSLTVGHKDNHSVVYSHPTVKSQAAAVNVCGANGWTLESLSLNDEDVDIEDVKDGVYTIPAESLNKDAALNAVFAYSDKPIFDFTTGVDTVDGCDYRVYSEDGGTLVIENIPANTMVSVYSTAGLHIVSENSGNGDVARIPLASGIYVVVIGQDALKIKH